MAHHPEGQVSQQVCVPRMCSMYPRSVSAILISGVALYRFQGMFIVTIFSLTISIGVFRFAHVTAMANQQFIGEADVTSQSSAVHTSFQVRSRLTHRPDSILCRGIHCDSTGHRRRLTLIGFSQPTDNLMLYMVMEESLLAVMAVLIYARFFILLAFSMVLKHIYNMLRSALFEILPFLVLFFIIFVGMFSTSQPLPL